MHVLMLLRERESDRPTVSLYADTPEGMERAMLMVDTTIKGTSEFAALNSRGCIGAWANDHDHLTLTREMVIAGFVGDLIE